jgi:hypothetical protein
MRLTVAEHATLKRLYLAKHLGRDQYAKLPDEIADLTDNFNALTGRHDSPDDVLHYVRTKAKAGKMGTHGDDWIRVAPLPDDFLSDRELRALVKIRREMKVAEDNIAHDSALARELETRFAARAGRRVLGLLLATYLMQLRKAGVLETLDQRHEGEEPFGDIDELNG